jgi:hypothetical protein
MLRKSICLYSEVADIVKLDFLLKILQMKGLGIVSCLFAIDERVGYDLTVIHLILLIVGAEITLCGGKGICIGLLSNIIN